MLPRDLLCLHVIMAREFGNSFSILRFCVTSRDLISIIRSHHRSGYRRDADVGQFFGHFGQFHTVVRIRSIRLLR